MGLGLIRRCSKISGTNPRGSLKIWEISSAKVLKSGRDRGRKQPARRSRSKKVVSLRLGNVAKDADPVPARVPKPLNIESKIQLQPICKLGRWACPPLNFHRHKH